MSVHHLANQRRLTTDQLKTAELHAGDRIWLSGTVYTARDAAHKRIAALLDAGEPLPFPIDGAVIYYAGPTQAKPGQVVGSFGPTTAGRMDVYAPRLYQLGLAATIGKGQRAPAVRDAVVRHGGLYLLATGGAGALAASRITACDVVAFEGLGCESVKRLRFKDFPLMVGIDGAGRDIYDHRQAVV